MSTKLDAKALEDLSIRERLSEEDVDNAPCMRAEIPYISQIAWRSNKTIGERMKLEDIMGNSFRDFSRKTEDLELDILYGGKKSVYEEAFKSLHDISKKPPPKGVQDKIIEYVLRLLVIDRWTWVHEIEESQSRWNKSSLQRPSSLQANFRIDSIKALMQNFQSIATVSTPKSLESSSMKEPSRLLQSIPSSSLSSTARREAARTVQECLLDQVADLGETYQVQKLKKVEENVATTALFVSYLFSGVESFEKFLLGIERYNAKAPTNKQRLANAALTMLRKPSTLPRRPLMYSAFISILTLLVGQKLSSRAGKTYTDWEMLQDGITLGCPDNVPLRDSERRMWCGVFDIATGAVGVREAVGQLLQGLPFDKIAKLPTSDDQALRIEDVGRNLLDDGGVVVNGGASSNTAQNHDWEGEDANEDGPVLVIVREVPTASTAVVEDIPEPQQIQGTGAGLLPESHGDAHGSNSIVQQQSAQGSKMQPRDGTGNQDEAFAAVQRLEGTTELPMETDEKEAVSTEAVGSYMEATAQVAHNASQVRSSENIEIPGPVIAVDVPILGLCVNKTVDQLEAAIFGGDVSPLSMSTSSPSLSASQVARDEVPEVGREDTNITAELSEFDKKELNLWSIGEICVIEMPKVKKFGLSAVRDCFLKDEPTLPLKSVFDHPLPPLKLVHTLKDRAPEEIRNGYRSVSATGDANTRFPLNAIGAWDVIHGAIGAKPLWNNKNNGLQWAETHLSDTEIGTLKDLTAAVPWDGKIDTLYGKLPISVLSKLLSDSQLNDETVDTMLSAMVVRMREHGVTPKGVWGVAHISFSQCLGQLQDDYRKGYPVNANPVLMHTGRILEQKDEVSLYGVANSQDAHWAAFCIAKTPSKIVVTWGDSLNWPVPHKFHEGLTMWLAHHCPNVTVEVDTTTMKHGVQADGISCGVIAINTLKHHFLKKELWVPERSHALRFESFVDVMECYLSKSKPQPSISNVVHWFENVDDVGADAGKTPGPSTKSTVDSQRASNISTPKPEMYESSSDGHHECGEEVAELGIPFPNGSGTQTSKGSRVEESSEDEEGTGSKPAKGKGRSKDEASSEDEEEDPVPQKGQKRPRVESSDEGSSQLDSGEEEIPAQSKKSGKNAPGSGPRRSTRKKKVPAASANQNRGTQSARPPRKKRKPTSPAMVDEVENANDEVEDVKPRLWTQHNPRERPVSSMLEDMEEEVVERTEMADDEEEEDPKQWLKQKSRDDAHVVATKTFKFFDITGNEREFTFKFTDEDDALFFEQMMDAVESNYVNGIPRWVADPKSSVFKILDYDGPKKSPSEMLELFEKKVIVVKDYPSPQVEWKPETIAKFGFLNKKQTIYDLSEPKVRVASDGKSIAVRRDHWGTLAMLFDCSQKPNPRPLLSLDNNMPGTAFWHDGAEEIATDVLGFNTVKKHPEGDWIVLPFNDQMWTLFATAGAWSLSHIDADGAATLVQPCHGVKLWFIIRGPDQHTARALAWPEQYNPPWALDRADFKNFMHDHTLRHLLTVEVMLLEGRMRLLMPPNQPHAVLSPTNSIFQGGHFYSLSTMRDTLAGLVHMLVQEKYITNTSHPALRMMIRKVVAYVHGNVFPKKHAKMDTSQCFDPNALNNHTMVHLFAVISLGFLCNILDRRTYQICPENEDPTTEEMELQDEYDYNGMTPSERRGCIWTRGMAVDLLDWFCAHYELKNVQRKGREAQLAAHKVVCGAVAHEAFGIYVAAKSVEAVPERKDMCAFGATSEAIRQQLEGLDNVAEVEVQIGELLRKFDEGEMAEGFNLLYDWSCWTCVPTTVSDDWRPLTDKEIVNWGCTSLDRAYMKGEENSFAMH